MLRFFAVLFCLTFAVPVWAQNQVWLQVEARPNQVQAEERARDYAGRLNNVAGFRLGSGWFAIVLGPYDAASAPSELSRLRIAGAVPRDAFIADGSAFGPRFWPDGPLPVVDTPAPAPLPELVASDETPAQARTSERLLTRPQREELQIALRWEGFYNSSIDGAFGPGTRRAMGAWQAANGFENTGVLTSAQRVALLGAYNDALASLAMAPVFDARAGIEIDMPTGLVAFDRYEAPFAHYTASTDDGVQVLLISQAGDATSFASLYEVLQSLRVIPLDGDRRRNRSSFSIVGANDQIVSEAYAELANGEIKGFVLTWPAGDEKRRSLAVAAMRDSFASVRGQVLPDNAGQGFDQSTDLLAGLEIRRPDAAISGFFVDASGAVLTAGAPVGSCERITLGEDTEMTLASQADGLALLEPRERLAPIAVARLATTAPRLNADIAVAGYSFGGALGAPSVTFGTLDDLRGLNGEDTRQRFTLDAAPGDTGGPILTEAGAILGVLLPREEGGRQLPEGVQFGANVPSIAEFLGAAGINAAAADESDALAPEDLTRLAADFTVLVNCWN